MEVDCQWLNLVWRLSPSRGLGRKINEQDRSSIESEDKSRCSDQYFGFFYHNSRNCTNGNAYCKIHTIMRLGRILGPVSSFLIRHFPYLCAICAWRTAFPTLHYLCLLPLLNSPKTTIVRQYAKKFGNPCQRSLALTYVKCKLVSLICPQLAL